MLLIQRQTIVEREEYRGTRAVKYRAITLSCVASGEPQLSYRLVWAGPFTKRVDQVERTQRQVKIVTKGLENVAYKDGSEALGTVKKESSKCLSSGGDCYQDEHTHLTVAGGTLASVAAVKADLDETSGNAFECQG